MTEKFIRVEADKELSYALDANHHRSVRAVTLQRALAEIDRLRAAITARDEAIRVATEAISQVSANGWTVADRIDALRDAAFERDSSRAGDWECCCSVCCDYRTLIIEFQLADAIRKARTALAALKETPDA